MTARKPKPTCACGNPEMAPGIGQCGPCIFGDKTAKVVAVIEALDGIWRNRARALLGRLHSVREIRPCTKCGREIAIILNRNGRQEPITDELKSHWADCPHADEFRARKGDG